MTLNKTLKTNFQESVLKQAKSNTCYNSVRSRTQIDFNKLHSQKN